MRARRLASLLLVTATFASLLTGSGAQADTDPAVVGLWSAPFSPGGEFDAAPPKTAAESEKYPAAASIVMLPSGRLVYWNGLQNLESCKYPLPTNVGACAQNSKSYMLDLTGETPLFFPADPEQPGGDDLFCSDQRLNANGELVVAGGTRWRTETYADIPVNEIEGNDLPDGLGELYGSKNTHLFRENRTVDDQPASDWKLGNNMTHGRWYPTLVTMPDGREFVAGGVKKLLWNSNTAVADGEEASGPLPQNVLDTEIYNPQTGTWSENPDAANTSLPLFARMHLLPNGEIFYTGAGQMWGPAGESVDQAEWNDLKVIDPAGAASGDSWRKVGSLTLGARSGAFSAPLPLKPPYDQASFLLGGGVLGTSPGAYLGTNLSEVVTVKDGGSGDWTASAELTSPMNNLRWYSSAVTLPNGQVVAVNGADKDEVVMPSIEAPVRQAELWDGSEWIPLASGSRDRTYHNSAILLPDGSVLVGGNAPINNFYGGDGGNNIFANNLKDPSFERFMPPYLFAGPRPKVLGGASAGHNGQGLPFSVANDSEPITKVVLSRLPSATHTTDADARTVEVPFTVNGGGNVSAQIPTSSSVVPPGYYYVFALSADGVPSHAFTTRITPN